MRNLLQYKHSGMSFFCHFYPNTNHKDIGRQYNISMNDTLVEELSQKDTQINRKTTTKKTF